MLFILTEERASVIGRGQGFKTSSQSVWRCVEWVLKKHPSFAAFTGTLALSPVPYRWIYSSEDTVRVTS